MQTYALVAQGSGLGRSNRRMSDRVATMVQLSFVSGLVWMSWLAWRRYLIWLAWGLRSWVGMCRFRLVLLYVLPWFCGNDRLDCRLRERSLAETRFICIAESWGVRVCVVSRQLADGHIARVAGRLWLVQL